MRNPMGHYGQKGARAKGNMGTGSISAHFVDTGERNKYQQPWLFEEILMAQRRPLTNARRKEIFGRLVQRMQSAPTSPPEEPMDEEGMGEMQSMETPDEIEPGQGEGELTGIPGPRQADAKHFAFFSIDGHGLPIAYKLQEEGHDVRVGIVSDYYKIGSKKKESRESKQRRLLLYDGMFTQRSDADALMWELQQMSATQRQQYFAVCDFNWLFPYADKLRGMGLSGLLPTKFDADMEKNREEAKQLVTSLYPDVEVATYHKFRVVDEAVMFLEQHRNMSFVVKGNDEECQTVVPEGSEPSLNHQEILDILKGNREEYEKEGFIFEEKIEDILEFTPEAIAYDGQLLAVSVDVETKNLGAGDTGPQTGCSLNLIRWLDLSGEIYERFLKPLERLMLRKEEWTIWDAGILYSSSSKKFYFTEFCSCRPGYNGIFTQMATLDSASVYFERLRNREPIAGEAQPCGASVRLFNLVPDDKYDDEMMADGLILANMSDPQTWGWDIKKKNGKFYTVGYDKNLAICAGAGDTMKAAVAEAYKAVGRFHWTRKYYRPQFDFLSEEYPTSIPNRLAVLASLFPDEMGR